MSFSDGIFQGETFIELLQYRAQNQPQQTAFTFLQNGETPSAHLTYQELDQQAIAIASQLMMTGQVGDRVLLLYRPSLDFIAAFMGCLYAGQIAVPVNPPRRIEKISKLEQILKDSQAQVILTNQKLIHSLKSRIDSLKLSSKPAWIETDRLPTNPQAIWQPPAIAADNLALLQYTSGSTGLPKGVMVSHHNLIKNAEVIHTACGSDANSLNVSWLPVFHDMGLMGNVLQPIYEGRRSILMLPVAFIQKPIRWLQAMSDYKATHSGAPNFAYDLLCQTVTEAQKATLDLSHWQMAFCGAEPIQANTLEKFAAHFASCGFQREAFYPCYGMAEATLFVTGGLPSHAPTYAEVDALALERNQVQAPSGQRNRRKVVGCGQVWQDTRIVIVNPETCTQVKGDDVGEIWITGSTVASGYWHQHEATLTTFQAYLTETGEGPFLRTGDLGFIQNQELFITGRLKEIMIFWGLNRYPQFIEQTAEKAHPDLNMNAGAAFAVNIEGSERLVLMWEVSRQNRNQVFIEEMVEALRWAIARDHFLDLYALVLLKPGRLPKTSSGKIQRYLCRIQFLEGQYQSVAEWRSPQKESRSPQQLLRHYLNPLTHIRRYWMFAKVWPQRWNRDHRINPSAQALITGDVKSETQNQR